MNKKRKERLAFLEMFVLLLENGFSIQEGLQVMIRSHSFSERLLDCLTEALLSGQPLGLAFETMGFGSQEVLQIQLAETHGNLIRTLKNINQNLKIMEKQQAELRKIMTYPIVLLIFSFGMLLSMRYILLPQLLASQMVDSSHWGIWFMTYSPLVLGSFLFVGCLLALFFHQQFKRKTILEKACFLSRLPFVGRLYIVYQTSCFSLEWGKLFKEGLEVKQILQTLIELSDTSLMVALAKELEQGLAEGVLLTNQLAKYPFLLSEFSLIVFQGEIKGKLGEELLIYSQLMMKQFVEKIEQGLKWIQPLVFVFIATIIIVIYVAMFLPIYGNVGGVIG